MSQAGLAPACVLRFGSIAASEMLRETRTMSRRIDEAGKKEGACGGRGGRGGAAAGQDRARAGLSRVRAGADMGRRSVLSLRRRWARAYGQDEQATETG